jgi:hypothetical protein
VDCRAEAIAIDVSDATQLSPGIDRSDQYRPWVSNHRKRSAKEPRDTNLDIAQKAFVILARIVPPLGKNCDARKVPFEARSRESSDEALVGMLSQLDSLPSGRTRRALSDTVLTFR